MKTDAWKITNARRHFSGRTVKFRNIDGEHVTGTLTRSDHEQGSQNVLLVVDGNEHLVCSYQQVEVA